MGVTAVGVYFPAWKSVDQRAAHPGEWERVPREGLPVGAPPQVITHRLRAPTAPAAASWLRRAGLAGASLVQRGAAAAAAAACVRRARGCGSNGDLLRRRCPLSRAAVRSGVEGQEL